MSRPLTLAVGPRDHIQGSPDAPVTLVEYGDYECPYCALAYPVVKALQRRYGAKLRFVFRNFPLAEVHPRAQDAALAAEAASVQGEFWRMHDALYEHQKELDPKGLARLAASVGLDLPRWQGDFASPASAARVHEDFMSGVRSGVPGTPAFFVNGAGHDGGFDYESLEGAIEGALRLEQRV